MSRTPFPLIPKRFHLMAWRLLLLGALLGGVGSAINGEWFLLVAFVIMGLAAVMLIRRPERSS